MNELPRHPRAIRLSADDNVVVAVDQLPPGAAAHGVTARERVPRGHKMAVAPIAQAEPVRKYGQVIGFAAKPIQPGDWVHEHNVEMHDFARDYRFAQDARPIDMVPPRARATFEGYRRADGKVGTICNMHLIASLPNAEYLEIDHDLPLKAYSNGFAVFEDPPVLQKNGEFNMPQGPGLGVSINKDLILS